jgi:hypothetical protein
MKLPLNNKSFLRRDWSEIEIKKQTMSLPLFDYETRYISAGILIWHIFEDRIFFSEGLCKMMGLSDEGLLNLELSFWMNRECKLRDYLKKLLDQVCSSEITETSFKTNIPGIGKEITGSVQLFDREEIGILDLMLICWEENQEPRTKSQD